MDLQPIKKSGVYSIFGKHYGDYLTNFITGCCLDIGTLCTSIKHCIGIFPEGNPNLVLNQQGDWIIVGNTFSGFSGQATANRGLSLKASSGDITDGIITVLVEFAI